jgi:predicted glutamine amidotransferase
MCRLFGQFTDSHRDASEPLCGAENALRTQSHRHPHGWGVAWYPARTGVPEIRRGVMAAHADSDFAAAARLARSRVVLAHVRDASVGGVALENTHPFVEGPWIFAHNGTVARFARVRAVREALGREIAAERRWRVRGDTDSERLFQLFLTRVAARTAGHRAGLEEVRRAMADVVRRVCRIADRGELRSTMNFLVSDGRLLAACRHGKPLHVAMHAAGDVFAVASEPIGRGGWEEVPEDGFVGIDGSLRILRGPLD